MLTLLSQIILKVPAPSDPFPWDLFFPLTWFSCDATRRSPRKNEVAKGPQTPCTRSLGSFAGKENWDWNSPCDRQIKTNQLGVFVRKFLGSTPWDFHFAPNWISIHTLLIFKYNYNHGAGSMWFYPAVNSLPHRIIYCFLLNTDLPPFSLVKDIALICYSGCGF